MEWEVSPRSALLTVLAICVTAGTRLEDCPVSVLVVLVVSSQLNVLSLISQ